MNKNLNKQSQDVGFVEDASWMLQNCYSAEGHCISSIPLDPERADDFQEANKMLRRIRGKWLGYIVGDGKNQLWCISKHLLGMKMGLEEMGNRFDSEGKKELATECFVDASEIMKLLLVLNNIGGKNEF